MTAPPTKIFGVPLGVLMSRPTERTIPTFVKKTIRYLNAQAIDTEGLFRISAKISILNTIKQKLDAGEDLDFFEYKDPHLISGLLKVYLRELPEPLFTFALYPKFVEAATEYEQAVNLQRTRGGDTTDQSFTDSYIEKLSSLIEQLPPPNKALAEILLLFLVRVGEHSAKNKMTPANLAIVFGQILLRPEVETIESMMNASKITGIMKFMIEKFEKLFPKQKVKPGTPQQPQPQSQPQQQQPQQQQPQPQPQLNNNNSVNNSNVNNNNNNINAQSHQPVQQLPPPVQVTPKPQQPQPPVHVEPTPVPVQPVQQPVHQPIVQEPHPESKLQQPVSQLAPPIKVDPQLTPVQHQPSVQPINEQPAPISHQPEPTPTPTPTPIQSQPVQQSVQHNNHNDNEPNSHDIQQAQRTLSPEDEKLLRVKKTVDEAIVLVQKKLHSLSYQLKETDQLEVAIEIARRIRTVKKVIFPPGEEQKFAQSQAVKYNLSSSSAERQGKRKKMEDTCLTFDNLRDEIHTLPPHQQWAFYAVYDGHGGNIASQLCKTHLHKNIVKSRFFANRQIKEAIAHAFEVTDKLIISKEAPLADKDGSTAVLVMICNNTLYVANTGDSEAILCKQNADGSVQAIVISEMHRPTVPAERERIEQAGGAVFSGRVFGKLAVSRCLGDPDFKMPVNEANFVSSEPFVNSIHITEEYKFILLACDGLFDRVDPQKAVEFLHEKLKTSDVHNACNELADLALDSGSNDNVTIVLAQLNWP